VGTPPVTLLRHATLERCRMNSHAGEAVKVLFHLLSIGYISIIEKKHLFWLLFEISIQK
jgi:hypothetical protein